MNQRQVRVQSFSVESLEIRQQLSAGLATRAVAPAGGVVARPDGNTGTGLFVSGGQVYDANGVPFVLRGINHTLRSGDTTKNLAALSEFTKTGANAVRAVFGTFGAGAAASQRQAIAEQLINEGIVPVVEDHSATSGTTAAGLQSVVDRWLQPDNVAWLKKDERNVILNIANEWGPDSTLWRDAYISSIARLRAAGINALIMVDAGGSGQNVHTLETWAQDVEDADPQHNVVFSIHMYNYWRTEDGAAAVGTSPNIAGAPWDVATELTKMKAAGLPVVAGEFSYTGGADVPYDTRRAMQIYDGLGLGWMAWSWNQNGNGTHDMLASAAGWQYDSDADLSAFGKLVINDPTLGLRATARPATTLRPGTITGTLNGAGAGATVYVDDNANGNYDAGEKAATTDGNGQFTLTNLPQGLFRLRVAGATATPVVVALAAGDTANVSMTLNDAPGTSSIQGTLFNDVGRDGTRDATDAGVSGQTVYLDTDGNGAFSDGEPTARTDDQGRYAFAGLSAGTYRVGFVLPDGIERSTAVLPVTLNAGEQLVNALVGVDRPAALGSITGVFFNDLNLNGVKDSGEAGVSLKPVYLDLNNNGAPDAGEPTTLTATNGTYLFTRLTPGTYVVRRSTDGWQVTGDGGAVTVNAFQTAVSKPIGAVELPGSISGIVYADGDGDGVVQPGDTPLAGVTVYLDADGNGAYTNGEAATVSDGNGAFTFGGLNSGSYAVRAVPPAGTTLTTGSFTVSLGTHQTSTTAKVGVGVAAAVPPGPTDGAISGVYFQDTNNDRRLSAGEQPVGGALVYLDANDDGIYNDGEPAQTTGGDGSFAFTGLAAGSYHLRTAVPAGTALTTPVYDVILSPSQQFAVARFGVTASSVVASPVQTLQAETATLSGGTVKATSYGGYIGSGFADYAGTKSAVEWAFNRPAAGVVSVVFRYANGSTTNRPLTLYLNGVAVGTVAFPGTGSWTAWANTAPIQLTLPAGTNSLKAIAGAPGGANVDQVSLTTVGDSTPPVVNPPVVNPPVVDPPVVNPPVVNPPVSDPQTASVSGLTFNDANANGVLDGNDSLGSGKTVFLDTNNNGVLDAAEKRFVTAADGTWTFTGLAAGDYHVRRVFPSGYAASTPLLDFTLTAGQAVGGLTIGSKSTAAPPAPPAPNSASLTGNAFNDNNADGKFNAGDGASKSATIFIDPNNNGLLDAGEVSVVTDSNGKFQFTGLPAGPYNVRRVLGTGQAYSTPFLNVTLVNGQAATGLLLGTKKA